jgi:hypothetical protein
MEETWLSPLDVQQRSRMRFKQGCWFPLWSHCRLTAANQTGRALRMSRAFSYAALALEPLVQIGSSKRLKAMPSKLKPGPDTFDYVHEEIHREHTLISNRMSWYVASQSCLF